MSSTQPPNFQGYGAPKVQDWSFRFDLPSATSAVVSDTLYLEPFTVDAIANISLANTFSKWDYTVTIPGVGSYTIIYYCGIYKCVRGAGGTSNTIIRLAYGTKTYTGNVSKVKTTVIVSPDVFPSLTSVTLPDGLYYMAFSWNITLTGVGVTASVNRYGANCTGTINWMYFNGGVGVGMPASINALAAGNNFRSFWYAK